MAARAFAHAIERAKDPAMKNLTERIPRRALALLAVRAVLARRVFAGNGRGLRERNSARSVSSRRGSARQPRQHDDPEGSDRGHDVDEDPEFLPHLPLFKSA
jgi:hypothetical protein